WAPGWTHRPHDLRLAGGQGSDRSAGRDDPHRRGHGLRTNSSQRLEQALLRCLVAARPAGFSVPARRLLSHRRISPRLKVAKALPDQTLGPKAREGLVLGLL